LIGLSVCAWGAANRALVYALTNILLPVAGVRENFALLLSNLSVEPRNREFLSQREILVALSGLIGKLQFISTIWKIQMY